MAIEHRVIVEMPGLWVIGLLIAAAFLLGYCLRKFR